MKNIGFGILVTFSILALLGADGTGQTVHFPQHGFSIAALEDPNAGGNTILLTMSLPPSDGISPNINVLSQDYAGSLDDYLALSKQQFADNKFKLISSQKLDGQTAVLEYSGMLNDRDFHWYAKVSLKGHGVLLATATATEKQWPDDEKQLRACIDSFSRDGAP